MTKLELIETIAIVVVAIAFILWFIVKSLKNKWISSIIDTANIAIKEAETNSSGTTLTGVDKKRYVMAKVEDKCNELHIPYYLLQSIISKLIDTTIKHYNVISK